MGAWDYIDSETTASKPQAKSGGSAWDYIDTGKPQPKKGFRSAASAMNRAAQELNALPANGEQPYAEQVKQGETASAAIARAAAKPPRPSMSQIRDQMVNQMAAQQDIEGGADVMSVADAYSRQPASKPYVKPNPKLDTTGAITREEGRRIGSVAGGAIYPMVEKIPRAIATYGLGGWGQGQFKPTDKQLRDALTTFGQFEPYTPQEGLTDWANLAAIYGGEGAISTLAEAAKAAEVAGTLETMNPGARAVLKGARALESVRVAARKQPLPVRVAASANEGGTIMAAFHLATGGKVSDLPKSYLAGAVMGIPGGFARGAESPTEVLGRNGFRKIDLEAIHPDVATQLAQAGVKYKDVEHIGFDGSVTVRTKNGSKQVEPANTIESALWYGNRGKEVPWRQGTSEPSADRYDANRFIVGLMPKIGERVRLLGQGDVDVTKVENGVVTLQPGGFPAIEMPLDEFVARRRGVPTPDLVRNAKVIHKAAPAAILSALRQVHDAQVAAHGQADPQVVRALEQLEAEVRQIPQNALEMPSTPETTPQSVEGVEAAQQGTGAGNAGIQSAADFEKAWMDTGKYAQEEASSMRALAEANRKYHGMTEGEYYPRMWQEITSGGQPSEGALMQEMSPVFYSKLERTINEKMGGSATSEQLRKTLEASGVKPEEMKYTGFDQFLADSGGKVTKQDALDFIRENQVQIKEVWKGELPWEQYGNDLWVYKNGDKTVRIQKDGNPNYPNQPYIGTQNGDFIDRYATIEDAKRDLGSEFAGDAPATKYHQYQLPGGENYRELLLTLPESGPEIKAWREWHQRMMNKYGSRFGIDQLTPEEDLQRTALARKASGQEGYRSSHWDEPNVLAHVRFNDRTGPNGERILHVEEIQSDWHQAGRKKGYRSPSDSEGWSVRSRDKRPSEYSEPGSETVWEAVDPNGETRGVYTSKSLAEEGIRQLVDIANEGKVPDAPFKKTWHELAIKRILRYAAEHGYDKVTWTPGEEQAARYDLSKQVDSISSWTLDSYGENGRGVGINLNSGDSISFDVDQNGKILHNAYHPEWDGKPLEEVVGKDIAQKIMSEGDQTLKGPDLKVGGEGMKGFYDRILPDTVNKLVKKWGGKAGETEINTKILRTLEDDIRTIRWPGGQKMRVPSLDITPEMRNAVLNEGQPLFQKGKGSVEFTADGKAILRAFENADVSTGIHEMAHVFLRNLKVEDRAIVKKAYGVEGEFAVAHEERFARGFERYMRDGKAPTPELASVFQRFKAWLTEIYQTVKGTPIEERIPKEVREVYDRMLGKDAKAGAVETEPPSIGQEVVMPTKEILRDPQRLQFKESNPPGNAPYNERFAEVLDVWRDPANGKTYVVNGHKRDAWAKRDNIPTQRVRYIDAATAAEARTFGALKNIAQGSGTPIDAAKVFRESGVTPADLKAEGLDLSGSVASQGLGLANLNDTLFNDVVFGRLPVERGAIIGRDLPNHADQTALIKLLKKLKKNVTNDTLVELIDEAKNGPKQSVVQTDLFGTSHVEQNLLVERAELSGYIRNELRKDQASFGGAAKHAERLRRGGNLIDDVTSRAIAEESARIEDVYGREKKYGIVSQLLDDGARRIASGENANTVKADVYKAVREEVSKTLARKQEATATAVESAPGTRTEPQPAVTPEPTPTVEPTSTPANEGRDLFTPGQLAEFDEHKIDVSGVAPQYKDEALQQLEFQKQQRAKLASPDYNDQVKAELNRQAVARGEKPPYPDVTEKPISPTDDFTLTSESGTSKITGNPLDNIPGDKDRVANQLRGDYRYFKHQLGTEVADKITVREAFLRRLMETERGSNAEAKSQKMKDLQLIAKDLGATYKRVSRNGRVRYDMWKDNHPVWDMKLKDVDQWLGEVEQARGNTSQEMLAAEAAGQGSMFGEAAAKGTGGGSALGMSVEVTMPRVSSSAKTAKPVEPVKASNIVKDLEKAFAPVRTGRLSLRNAVGEYHPLAEMVRIRKANDLPTVAHEVGHHLHKLLFPDIRTPKGNLSAKAFPREYWGELSPLAYPGAKGKVVEGYAEFMRLWMTDPAKAQAQSPKFFQHFTSVLDANPAVKKVMQKAQADVKLWIDQPAQARVQSTISHNEPSVTRPTTLDGLYTQWVDSLHPLNRAEQRITGGEKIPESKSAFKEAWRGRGIAGKAQEWLEHGVTDEAGLKVGKSLKDIIQPVADDLEAFERYAVAKHGIDVIKAKGSKAMPLDIRDYQEVVQAAPEHYEKVLSDLVNYQDKLLQELVDSGVLSGESKAKMREAWPNHIPLYRVMDKAEIGRLGKAVGKVANPVKRLKGSGRDIISPIESIVKDTYVMLNVAQRNRVMTKLTGLAKSYEGAGELVFKVPAKMQPTTVKLGDVLKIRPENPVWADLYDLMGATPDDVSTVFKPNYKPGGSEHVIRVFEKGKPVLYELEPELYHAVMGTDSASASVIMDLISKPASLLRAGATLTPEFGIRNPMRDAPTAFVLSKSGMTPFDWVRGLFEVVKAKTGKLGGSELYHQWQALGGANSAMVSIDRNYLQASVRDIKTQPGMGKVIDIVTHPIDALRALSETTEQATRVADFGKSVGWKMTNDMNTLIKAVVDSRDVTLDFSRSGNTGKQANRVIAFFNAAVQDVDKLARTFKDRPAQTTAKAVAYITAPSVLLYLMNRNNPKYLERPEWEKDTFWLIPTPGDGPVVRIPKPFLLGMIFGSMPERIMRELDKKDPHAWDDYANNLISTAAPGVIPTALLPWIQITANKSFTGTSIVPQREADLPKPLQYGTQTSEVAKALGKLTNQSPRMIDYAVRGYTGGLGQYSVQGIDTILKAAGLVHPPPSASKSVAEFPVIRGVMANPWSGSVYVERFYRELTKLREAKAYDKAGQRKMTEEDASRLDVLEDTARMLSELRKSERQIQAAMDDKELATAMREGGIPDASGNIRERKRAALLYLKSRANELAQSPVATPRKPRRSMFTPPKPGNLGGGFSTFKPPTPGNLGRL